VHVKLNPEFPWQKQHSQEDSFHQQIGVKFKEGTSKMQRLKYRFIWSWNLDTSESRSEISGKFWNVVLEKDGEDQLDRQCEKWSLT
jgi:hypothetical protein